MRVEVSRLVLSVHRAGSLVGTIRLDESSLGTSGNSICVDGSVPLDYYGSATGWSLCGLELWSLFDGWVCLQDESGERNELNVSFSRFYDSSTLILEGSARDLFVELFLTVYFPS